MPEIGWFGVDFETFLTDIPSFLRLAVIFTIMSMGAFVGYGLSAFSLAFHTDFYKIDVDELGYDDKDPRWIGAWWLGYLVYAGMFILLGIPFFFFPKVGSFFYALFLL